MSLYDHLLANRTKQELAKQLVHTVKENVALKDAVFKLETELFWLNVSLQEKK